jgi:hypothetical protein
MPITLNQEGEGDQSRQSPWRVSCHPNNCAKDYLEPGEEGVLVMPEPLALVMPPQQSRQGLLGTRRGSLGHARTLSVTNGGAQQSCQGLLGDRRGDLGHARTLGVATGPHQSHEA